MNRPEVERTGDVRGRVPEAGAFTMFVLKAVLLSVIAISAVTFVFILIGLAAIAVEVGIGVGLELAGLLSPSPG